MRVQRRIPFSPALGRPAARARRVERNLMWHGITGVRRQRETVGFARHGRVYRSDGARKVGMIAGGCVRLDPGGRHADLELRFPARALALPAIVAGVAVLAPVPWWPRALAMAVLAMTALRWRRAVAAVAGFVRAAAEGPL
jgi:hypothetical protein